MAKEIVTRRKKLGTFNCEKIIFARKKSSKRKNRYHIIVVNFQQTWENLLIDLSWSNLLYLKKKTIINNFKICLARVLLGRFQLCPHEHMISFLLEIGLSEQRTSRGKTKLFKRSVKHILVLSVCRVCHTL